MEWGKRWQAGKGELEDGAERPWRELRDAYAEAADLLKRANNKVERARVLLDKMRRDERIIDREEMGTSSGAVKGDCHERPLCHTNGLCISR